MAVAGGGIIGLSLALELALAGREVTVFERGRAMGESSWAAAGMLAAADPENPPQLRALADFSRALYPRFLDRVTQLSGVDVPIRTTQTIQGAAEVPRGLIELDAASLYSLAPGISRHGLKFFLLEEQSLSPRDLALALPRAATAAGVTIHEECPVLGSTEDGNLIDVTTSQGEWTAETLVYATGAWTEGLAGIPVTPRKGQMVAVSLADGPQPGVVLRTPEIYLVPRGNGRMVIGATVEKAGFDKLVHDSAIAKLMAEAAALWPPVRDAKIIETWAGLRPGTPDDLPVIGSLTDCGGELAPGRKTLTWVAAGHFRNGIQLAPGTARLLKQMILGESLSIDASPFRCGRFALSSVQ